MSLCMYFFIFVLPWFHYLCISLVVVSFHCRILSLFWSNVSLLLCHVFTSLLLSYISLFCSSNLFVLCCACLSLLDLCLFTLLTFRLFPSFPWFYVFHFCGLVFPKNNLKLLAGGGVSGGGAQPPSRKFGFWSFNINPSIWAPFCGRQCWVSECDWVQNFFAKPLCWKKWMC